MKVDIGLVVLALVVGILIGALLNGLDGWLRSRRRDWRDLNRQGPRR